MSGERDKDIEVDADGNPYVTLGGVRALLVTEADAERADFVVCSEVGYFEDDVQTTCAHCGIAIVHRPHAPSRPPKVCMACASRAVADRQQAKPVR